jgi:C1A family cysteine protease
MEFVVVERQVIQNMDARRQCMKWGKHERLVLSVVLAICAVFYTGSLGNAANPHLDEIKAAIEMNGKQWVADETSVSNLPDHEKKLRLGLIKRKPTGKERILSLQDPMVGLPTRLDWRANPGNFVTPVRNQGSCGSCWAFATTGALESYILIREGRPAQDDNRAEEILLSCSTAGTCNGGYIGTASNYIRDTGLPPETYFTYTASATDNSCANAKPGWENATSKIASWSYVNTTSISIDAIKNALASYGPLVTTMDVYADFFNYRSGVYEYVSGAYQGGHAILIVGYQDDPIVHGGGYFIVKNSWGTGWGEAGFFKVAYSQAASPVYFGEWTIAYKQPVTPIIPLAPGNLTASAASSSQINLSWSDTSANEDGFEIACCEGDGCSNFLLIATVGANTSNYSDMSLIPNTTYGYQIRAYNSVGRSGYSNIAYATTQNPLQRPSAPLNLVATAVPKTKINLSWTDVSSNETGFRIERCTGTNCTNFSQIASVGANVTHYTNSGLRRGMTYIYRVKGYNAGGDSDPTNTAVAKAIR